MGLFVLFGWTRWSNPLVGLSGSTFGVVPCPQHTLPNEGIQTETETEEGEEDVDKDGAKIGGG